MKDLLKELEWRGMLHNTMPGIDKQLKKEITSAYIGFDPTASSLHIGNLATLMLLVHLQRAGHKPYALVGGATGMVGDPSGKSQERNLLDEETLRFNQEGVRKQLEKFLDFDCGENSAQMVNNYDWFKEMNFLHFLRDVGKHLSVNYMMAKDSVKSRLETGLSFTEFSYQLLQGYDFYHLYTHFNVKLQMGGSDQWGNITSGTELIRRKSAEQGHAFAITCPLVTKANGQKFGKSESGNVWLDPKMTTPYEFYQFWLNCDDNDAPRLIRVFSLLTKEEIENLEKEHAEAPHKRILQKAIAQDVTVRVHGQNAYQMAVKASNILFGKAVTDDLKAIDEATLLSVFQGVPRFMVSKVDFENAQNVSDLLAVLVGDMIFKSKGEAKKAIKAGSIGINKIKLQSFDQEVAFELLQSKYLLVQKGKKNYFLIVVE